MVVNIPREGKYRPEEKQILNTGMVIICTNIEGRVYRDHEGKPYYTFCWLESRYSTSEYLAIVEQEKDILKLQVDTQQETINQQQVVIDELLFEIIPSLTGEEVL